MLNPRTLEKYAQPLIRVYEDCVAAILINMSRHFNTADADPDAFAYQARLLAEAGQVTQENRDIIAQLTGQNSALLREALTQAILAALKDVDPQLKEQAEQGLLSPPAEADPQLSPRVTQVLDNYYAQASDKMNLVNTVMLESSLNQYRQAASDVTVYAQRLQAAQSALNTAAGEAILGISTQAEARTKAVTKMVNAGLTGFVDAGGHRWSPEAYVAMDIRTTVTNTAHQATWARCDDYGLDLIVVSTKAAARPLCYPWQGKVLSRTDNAREVTDFDGNPVHVYAMSETSYGEPAGLFGINCGHFSSPFFPGVSKPEPEPVGEKENEAQYQASQRQRYLERRVRQAKLKQSCLKAAGDDKAAAEAKDDVRQREAELASFLDESGRTRRRDREYTPTRWKEEWAQ